MTMERLVEEFAGRAEPVNVDLLIGGDEQAAESGERFDVVSSRDGRVVTRAAAASLDDALRAANNAAAAFPVWSGLEPGRRRHILSTAADLVARYSERLVEVIVRETGTTRNWARFNCEMAEQFLRDAAATVTYVRGESVPSDLKSSWSLVQRTPVGVVLGMAPWNAALLLGVRAVAMPLACGNTVVLKSSELCPATHYAIGAILREAGLPPGALNVISNAPPDAQAIVDGLIAHPAIRRVNFTGSTRVGRLVALSCAKQLKRCLLELGGKCPLIVLRSADLDLAADAAVFGAFANQGQACMSTERLIIDNAVAETLIGKIHERASALNGGPMNGLADRIGCLVNHEASRRALSLVDDAVSKGAKLILGGQVHESTMEATLLDGVHSGMRIYHEESFAPILPIIRVSSPEEAVTIANDTEYGLAAAVFTSDMAEAIRLSRQIETGVVQINGPTIHDEAQIPFGGVKSSGYGRFGGWAGIDEFTELRWVSVHEEPRKFGI